MIALDTSTKIGKSPKRQKVEKIIKNDEENEESIEQEDSDNDDESTNENDEQDEVNNEEESDNADESNDDDDDDDDDDDVDEENNVADDADDENMQSDNEKSDNNDDEEIDEDDDESKTAGNAGWADVMQKILKTNKPKKKKTLVLSRAKKISEIVPKVIDDKPSVKVVDKDGKIKDEIKDEKNEKLKVPVVENELKRKKKEPIVSARIKPSVLDKDREKTLQKIATKGVVQLFNAVKQQQTEIKKKIIDAGPLERKREKVLKNIDKNAFLDVLMGGTKSIKVDNTKTEAKKEEIIDKKAENVWNVLRDDFAMGANLKDWDKNAPEDDDSSAPEDMDSD